MKIERTIANVVRDHGRRHNVCPCCGHPVPGDDIAAVLTKKQREIYLMLVKAGSLGLSRKEIIEVLYRNDPNGMPTGNVISAHIVGLNKRLDPFGLYVRGKPGPGETPYRLISRETHEK